WYKRCSAIASTRTTTNLCGQTERGCQLLDPPRCSLGARPGQPATPAGTISGQKLDPAFRRRVDHDVGRRLAPLARPSLAVEADRVDALASEAHDPCDGVRRAHATTLEVSHDAVHDSTGVNRLSGPRQPHRMIDTPDEQRIDHGRQRLPLGRQLIPHLTLVRSLTFHDLLG